MIEWIDINSTKIRKIAYNSEIKIMYIDFVCSTIDTQYSGVSEKVFIEFSMADDIDQYYDSHINDVFEKVELNIVNNINLNL